MKLTVLKSFKPRKTNGPDIQMLASDPKTGFVSVISANNIVL